MTTIRLVAEEKRVKNPNRVKRGRGKECEDVYEMRGGQARLFFFYTPDTEEVVVCTHTYWKAKPSAKEQDNAFKMAAKTRQQYLKDIKKTA